MCWRDDDASAPTPALDRLIELAGARPLALAVIPNGDLNALAARLAKTSLISVGQHGVDHIARSARNGARSEYSDNATTADLARAIGAARASMIAAGLEPSFYTPPWNAVQPDLAKALKAVGLTRLSAGAEAPPGSDLDYQSSDVDILRWSGGPRFRGGWKVLSTLNSTLKRRRTSPNPCRPIGLLTHHLDHDETAWAFLAWLLPLLDRWFDWRRIEDETT